MVVLLPGDVVADAAPSPAALKIGPSMLTTPGVEEGPASLTAMRGGALGHVETTERRRGAKRSGDATSAKVHGWWVEASGTRYVPAAGDLVIGQVVNRGVESYTVSLFAAHHATLPVLAFEGATRRNRPNLEVGTLVYARVVRAEPWTEPELSCVDATTGKAQGLGELKSAGDTSAMLWPVSLALTQSMSNPRHTLLSRIAEHFPFEAAIGVNGLVWTAAASAPRVVALGRLLRDADQVARGKSALRGESDDDARATGEPAHTLPERIAHRGELSDGVIAMETANS
ncbi:exosome non-catalytic core subunit rrp40 [Malassezia sp. CBS 17886]|nr:exosome non-catalytic core subunit rrp40 [Malassezia sp. CBS 17886]